MMKKMMTAVKTSISEVMETMFYLPVEIGEESTMIQAEIGINDEKANTACELKFSGDCSGCFTLVVPKNLLSEITDNFMGESREHLKDEHLSGTLTEMLNMVCGNALSKVDSKIPFKLDIPEVVDFSKISENKLFTMIKTPESVMAIALTVN